MGQQLLFKRKHRCVVPIHGHLYRKLKREVSRTEKRLKIATTSMFSRRRRRSRARKEWICERRCQVSVSGVVYMYFRDCFALKPFRDYSLCSVCILPQPAFYSQSAVCILHSVCILPLVRSLQSAVCSPQSAFYTDRKLKAIFPASNFTSLSISMYCFL